MGTLIYSLEDRRSDSPFVDRIWRAQSERPGAFRSIAMSGWEMVVTRQRGTVSLTVRGPETKATGLRISEVGTDYFGIRFKIGMVMPHFPASCLVDQDVTLPAASGTSFWMNGSAWPYPDFDNADTFLNRLAREGLLARNPVVETALQGRPIDTSPRNARRHFLRTTGLTHSTIRQIERARYAAVLLQEGRSILDVVHETGYYDQPHLTRALKHLIGQTPVDVMRKDGPEPLSYLYKTEPFR